MPTGGHGNSAGLVRLAGKASASAVKAAAAQAGPDPVDIPAGLPGTVMAFKGADAPPHVILHGPSGQVFDTGSGNAPVEAQGFAALKNDETDITEIVIEKPAAGRWTVETAADSSRLVQGIQADGTRPVDGDRQGHRLRPRPPARLHGQGHPGRRPRRVRRGRQRRRRADRHRQGRRPRHAEVPPGRSAPRASVRSRASCTARTASSPPAWSSAPTPPRPRSAPPGRRS